MFEDDLCKEFSDVATELKRTIYNQAAFIIIRGEDWDPEWPF